MKAAWTSSAAVAAALAAVASAGLIGAASAAPPACSSAAVGLLAPLGGRAGYLGQEQLSWSRFAVARFNARFRTSFRLAEADIQLSNTLAAGAARRMVADRSVLAVATGGTSDSVAATGKLFAGSPLALVAAAATRDDLTSGVFPTFFRVVAPEAVQAPHVAHFVAGTLKPKRVVLLAADDDYDAALADALQPLLVKRGLSVARQEVSAAEDDFAQAAAAIGGDVDLVVFAAPSPLAAQALDGELRARGMRAVIFATDGAYSPAHFRPVAGYAVSFANDLHFFAPAQPLVRAYRRFAGQRAFGTLGPPAYMATWVALAAMNRACADGKISRTEVVGEIARTNLPSILGGRIRFTARGDVRNPKFYIFRISGGRYRLVA